MTNPGTITRSVFALLLAVVAFGARGTSPVVAEEHGGGFVTFETGKDGAPIRDTIPGVVFTTALGGDWVYGDVTTGAYNAPYPADCPDFGGVCQFAVSGNVFAWLGDQPGPARIEFTQGPGTFFSASFSTADDLTIVAYTAQDQRVGAQSLSPNTGTGRLDQVDIVAPASQTIAYVLISGTPNRWIMDDMATDAPGVPDQRPGSPTPEETVEDAEEPAFVTVAQYPDPNIAVRPGGIVTYTVVVTNQGAGSAEQVSLSMPYDPAVVQVLDARFSQDDAWVSAVLSDTLVLETGRVSADGGVVTATVRLAVLPQVPLGTQLTGRLLVEGDGVEDGRDRSNQTTLVVGSSDHSQPFYALSASPARGPSGATYVFSSAIFVPREPVTFWYRTPAGSDVEVGVVAADADGVVTLPLTTTDLAAGTYSMVAYGNWSSLTSVGVFQVE